MKKVGVLIMFQLLFCSVFAFSQTQKTTPSQWITVSDDEIATISYDSNIVTNKYGKHFVWVKNVVHAPEWQEYFTEMIGSRVPVVMTKTKAEYDEYYSIVRVRQVIFYSKAGKQLFNTGDSGNAGWGYVNASDPVGIVGEYLGDLLSQTPNY